MPELFVIDKFLGRNTEDVETDIHPGFATVATDIDFRDTRGCLKGAKQHSLLYSLGVIYGLFFWRKYILASTSGSLYSNGILVSAAWGGVFTATEFQGWVALANGTAIKKFDGTNLYNIGITAPVKGSCSAAGTGSGTFTVKDWKYKVTFVNSSGFESNACAEIQVSNTGSGQSSVNITSIPTGAAADNVTARRIYRTVDKGESYFLLTIISNNTGTTYSDSTLDETLGSASPPTNHDVPTQSCTMIERASKRWFISGSSAYPRRVWYSLSAPYGEGFPALYYEDFPADVKLLVALGDNLVVLTEDGPYMFMGLTSPAGMYVKELPNRIPAQSKFAGTQFDNKVYWRGPSGLYATNGISVIEDSENIRSMFDRESEASCIEVDSDSRILCILNNFYASADYGKIVRMQDSNTADPDTFTLTSNNGRIVRIINTDTYNFTSEYGTLIHLGPPSADIGTTIVRETRGNDLIWSNSSQPVLIASNDDLRRILYIGNKIGVYKGFTGNRMSWVWKSVKSHLSVPEKRKKLTQVSLRVNGSMTVNIYGDDLLLYTCSLVETDLSTVKIKLPRDSWAYEFQIEFIGSSTGIVNPPILYFFEIEKLN